MNAILIGAPGAGKGTQALILQDTYAFEHVASGDLLREAVRDRSPLGQVAKTYMDRGALVPDDVVIAMMLERLERPRGGNGVILDGFPRTLEQARALDEALSARHQRLDAVLYIDVPVEILMERLTKRYQCSNPACGAIYNWGGNQPRQEGLCDRCGSGLYQRLDDNHRTVSHRLEAYFRQTIPLIKHYEATGQLYRVDGNRPIPQVTRQILAGLGWSGDEPGSTEQR